jgi:hypothetical protein
MYSLLEFSTFLRKFALQLLFATFGKSGFQGGDYCGTKLKDANAMALRLAGLLPDKHIGKKRKKRTL